MWAPKLHAPKIDKTISKLLWNSASFDTLFVLIFARTDFRAFAQKNPFAREN